MGDEVKNTNPIFVPIHTCQSMNLITWGGGMQNTDILFKGVYTFEDIYKQSWRLNIVAHGELINNRSYLIANGNFGKRLIDEVELTALIISRYNLTRFNSIRLLSCFSGNGGELSFASRLRFLTGKTVKAYVGPITTNCNPDYISSVFLHAEQHGCYDTASSIFSSKCTFEVIKSNPYLPTDEGYHRWGYNPVYFF